MTSRVAFGSPSCRTISAPAVLAFAVVAVGGEAHAQIGFRQVTATYPVAVQRGTSAEVKLRSNYTLDEAYAVFTHPAGVRMAFAEHEPVPADRGGRTSAGAPFRFHVDVPADQMPGVVEYRVATKQAVSSVAQLLVTDFPVVQEKEGDNGTASAAQPISLPAAVCGVCEAFEDVDCFRIAGRAGEPLTIEMFAQRVTDRLHGMVVRGPRIYLMDPIVTVTGPNGQVIEQNDNCFGGDSYLHCTLPADGEYVIEVRDARYAGDARYTYCLEVSSRPYVHAFFPMAVQQGSSTQHELIADGLDAPAVINTPGDTARAGVFLRRAALPAGESTAPVRADSNPATLIVSPSPQTIEQEPNNEVGAANEISVPSGVNGRLSEPDDVDAYRFTAAKGEVVRFEIEAARHGLPLDAVLEVYDAEGKLLVESDDRSSPRSKDAALDWTAPADGQFVVAVRDLHGRGGARFVYHLRAEPRGPDFELFGEYYYAMLAPGVRTIWFAKIERKNGFDAPVQIDVEGLPAGVHATPVTIPAGMNHCAIVLTADDNAPINASLVGVVGRATIYGPDGESRAIVRRGHVTCEQQSSGGGQARWPIHSQLVAVTRGLDLTRVEATPAEVELAPGGSAEINVRITRAAEFKDAVTLAMSFDYFATKFGEQLPPGVTMSDKSAVRLTGDTLEGKIILTANDKPTPVEKLPIAVMARVAITFSITTNYASNPVLLTVKPAAADGAAN